MEFNGLGQINIELSSRCNKNCWMCGRRKRERELGPQDYGDIHITLLKMLAIQAPRNIMIAFHNNGEGLLYPRFGEAVNLFGHCITYLVSNGKLLMDKADEIIDNLDILSISVIENEEKEEKENQIDILRRFLLLKKERKPNVILRFVGDVNEEEYKEFSYLPIVRRLLHKPEGSIGFKRPPTIPEHGVCQDLLNRLAVDRYGNVSVCVRFDPDGELRLGNLKEETLLRLWNSKKRRMILCAHKEGRRKELPFCGSKCEFYGVPTGGENG